MQPWAGFHGQTISGWHGARPGGSGKITPSASMSADERYAIRQFMSLVGRLYGLRLADSGIDEDDRLANSFNDQWAVGRVFGNKEIAGIVDLSDLVAQKHFGIRIEFEEIFAIAPDEEYPLVMSV
jgi:hypothetical protein